MNYFAHALPFLDRPHFLAGTGVPDWLSVVDRRVRLRTRHAEAFCDHANPDVADVAAGVLQHLRDDARFHASRAFAETSLTLTAWARDALSGERGSEKGDRHPLPERPCGCVAQTEPVPVFAAGGDTSMRPAFLGHLLVELLLDAALVADAPDRLTEYYRVLGRVAPDGVEAAVNRMAPCPTERLGLFIGLFLRERILWDYLEDDKLLVRLNQVMRRVGLAALPNDFTALLPAARKLVNERKDALMEGIPR